MEGILGRLLTRFAGSRPEKVASGPLLVELLQQTDGEVLECYTLGPFSYSLKKHRGRTYYQLLPNLDQEELSLVREAVLQISGSLQVENIGALTFSSLVDVLSQGSVGILASVHEASRVRSLSRLAAFEAVGIPTIYALSQDNAVSEFFVDAPNTPAYLDHARYGRCESEILLTERERKAIETHLDTFKGYSMDYSNPSLKNEFDIFGNRLRISLDLAPLAVNSFALDVRKLTSSNLSLKDLIGLGMISTEAACFLIAVLEVGMNVTIVGETGTGKTTLLNALDEAMTPQLRRVYIEDAVETKDLLGKGYHQMKLKVDPFERGPESTRTKSVEIIKILHRSPDVVILGEIQSEEHSAAFFQALSAGIRGLQTFHASGASQALRRWQETHGISRTNLSDLDVIVEMVRPEKLGSTRLARSISVLVDEGGEPGLREVFARTREGALERTCPWEVMAIRKITIETLLGRLEGVREQVEGIP